jgi:hypothetical protein
LRQSSNNAPGRLRQSSNNAPGRLRQSSNNGDSLYFTHNLAHFGQE